MFAERVNKWIAEDNAEGIAEGILAGKPEESFTGKRMK